MVINFLLEVQTPEDRVFRRVRNTMSALVTAELDSRIRRALDRMSEAEIRAMDEGTSRIGLSGDRIIELE